MKNILVSVLVAAMAWGCATQNYEPPQTLKIDQYGLVLEDTVVTGYDKKLTDGIIFEKNDYFLSSAKDKKLAYKMAQKYADAGDKHAMTVVGVWHILGSWGVTKDKKVAFQYLTKASQKNNHMAKRWLARLYGKGEVVKKDCDKAIQLMTQSFEEPINDLKQSMIDDLNCR